MLLLSSPTYCCLCVRVRDVWVSVLDSVAVFEFEIQETLGHPTIVLLLPYRRCGLSKTYLVLHNIR